MSQKEHSHKDFNGKCQLMGTAIFSGVKADILLGGVNAPMTVMGLTVEPGMGSPAHISHSEDKVFMITEGKFTFLVGTQTMSATAGESIFVGKGAPHSFVASDNAIARMTLVATPGRHDRFFQAMSKLSTPHKMEDVQTVFERFDQTIVGPMIEPN